MAAARAFHAFWARPGAIFTPGFPYAHGSSSFGQQGVGPSSQGGCSAGRMSPGWLNSQGRRLGEEPAGVAEPTRVKRSGWNAVGVSGGGLSAPSPCALVPVYVWGDPNNAQECVLQIPEL